MVHNRAIMLRFIVPSILLSITLTSSESSTRTKQCSSYHVNANGTLFYFNGEHGFDFENARRLCKLLGGRLPVIHSADDMVFIKQIVSTAVWLGGTRLSNGSHEWDDKSPFDYAPWDNGEPNCNGDSCAIFVTRRAAKIALIDVRHNAMHVVCQMTTVGEHVSKKLTAIFTVAAVIA